MREEEAPDPADVVSWEERRLCPDGGCLGVVGADGACNECGRVDPEAARRLDERAAAQSETKSKVSGAAAAGDAAAGDDGDGDSDGAGEDASAAGSGAAVAGGGELGDDWQRRQLCEDGACIGVVIDGRCNTCGKAQ